MTAASKNLIPVSLELGGKRPCIVDETADIPLAAKRIAWGKCLNAGQTCVAPDYVLVHTSVKKRLISELVKNINAFYGEEPHNNSDYPKIINQKHFDRLSELLEGAEIAAGGRVNPQTRQIEPTVLDNVNWDSRIMEEEIFGPLLPVLEFGNIRELIPKINSRPKPLALYLFTNSKDVERDIIKNISFGGGCVNDTLVHMAHMAFGGVGESGMGSYHGEASYQTFTHNKSVLKKSNLIDIPLRYPPYKDHLNILKKIMK
jgi:aldehyde dehydrogenase (NAD+)